MEVIKALNELTEQTWLRGNYEEARGYIKQALAKEELELQAGNFKKKDVLFEKAYSINNLATTYRFQGNYSLAIENHLKALKIREEIGDNKGIARTYLGIGSINDFMGKTDEALKYKYMAKALYQKIKYDYGVAHANSHIASIYFEKRKYELAKQFNMEAILIDTKLNNLNGMANGYSLAGQIYEETNEYTQAIENYNLCLTLKKAFLSKDGIIDCNVNLGLVNIKIKKYDQAKTYLYEALTLAKQIGAKESQKYAYKGLCTIDSINRDFVSAFKNYKLYIAYRDSLVNQNASEKVAQLQAQFENDKSARIKQLEDEQIEDERKDKERIQKLILYFISAAFILMLVFSFFLYRNFKQKQKANAELQHKNQIIEKQKHLVEEKQNEILDSINYAKRIQYSLLANDKLLSENLPNHFLLFKPKDVVSGDFYWGAKLSNNHFALVTADSTGHGVPGSIMSILNMSCLNESIIADKLIDPADILNATRKKIIEHLADDGSEEGGKDGMDGNLICFDLSHKKLTYAAANNPVWVVREKELIALEADRMPIGKHLKDAIPFVQHTFDLKSGDMVYTFTDGYPDQFGGPKGKKFKYKQLEEVLISISDKPMDVQKNTLNDTFENWKGSLEQIDDVCVIGVRI